MATNWNDPATWTPDVLKNGKNFFASNPDAGLIASKQAELGLTNDSLADYWAKSTGGSRDQAAAAIGGYYAGKGNTNQTPVVAPVTPPIRTPDTNNNPTDPNDPLASLTPKTVSYDAAQAPTTPAATVTGYKYGTANSTDINKSEITGYDPTHATASTPDQGLLSKYMTSGEAKATDVVYDPSQGSVSGIIDKLLKSGSPLMDRAKAVGQADATQAMNARGLVNSSMAAQATTGAAEDALYKYALQIGAMDAASYNDRMARNKAAIDQFTLTNKAANDRAIELTSNSINNLLESNAIRETDVSKLNASMDTAAKQLLAATQNEALFKNVAGRISVSLANAGFENAAAAFGAAASNASALQYAGNQQQTSITNTAAANQAVSESAAAQNKASAQAADISFQRALQVLKGEQAVELAQIEADYRKAIQTSDSAARLFTTITAGITSINSAPNTLTEDKTKGTTALTDMLKNGLAVIGNAGTKDIDLTTLLTINTAPA